jgi:hypothetical protein
MLTRLHLPMLRLVKTLVGRLKRKRRMPAGSTWQPRGRTQAPAARRMSAALAKIVAVPDTRPGLVTRGVRRRKRMRTELQALNGPRCGFDSRRLQSDELRGRSPMAGRELLFRPNPCRNNAARSGRPVSKIQRRRKTCREQHRPAARTSKRTRSVAQPG